LPYDGYGFFQILFLTAVYGYILFIAANLISDGSEFLLLIPAISGMVGSIVLPVLGAVPDAAIVIFSGLGSDAQYQLEVGIGALAGSTILLLTVPWFLIITAGRVDVAADGKCKYTAPKLTPPDRYDFFNTGIVVSSKARVAALIMLVTSTSYLIIEGGALTFRDSDDESLPASEASYALGAFVIAIIFFVAYLTYAYIDSGAPEDVKNQDSFLTEGLADGNITLVGVVGGIMAEYEGKEDPSAPKSGEDQRLVGGGGGGKTQGDERVVNRLKNILKPFFKKYDKDGSNALDVEEMGSLLKDLGETLKPEQIKSLFRKIDLDKSGSIDFNEFVTFAITFTQKHPEMVSTQNKNKSIEMTDIKSTSDAAEASKDDEEEDGEEMPEDLLSLSPAEQQRNIWWRASWRMLLGTALVVLFSDPMVDCFSAIGERIGVRAFYVAFVLAPIASNASEIVASFKYAMKKTTGSITISMGALLGAAIMNNTLVFGVMQIIIYTQALYFEYFAEVIAILMVEIIIGVYVLSRTNHLVVDSYVILSLYPISLVVVWAIYTYVPYG